MCHFCMNNRLNISKNHTGVLKIGEQHPRISATPCIILFVKTFLAIEIHIEIDADL